MYHSIIILIDRLVHNRTNSTNDVGGEPDLDELIERHGGPAPRYVAYPSPSLWRDPPHRVNMSGACEPSSRKPNQSPCTSMCRFVSAFAIFAVATQRFDDICRHMGTTTCPM